MKWNFLMIANIRVMTNVPVFQCFGLNAQDFKFFVAVKKHALVWLMYILGVFTGTAGTSLKTLGLDWNRGTGTTGTGGTLCLNIKS